MALAISPRDQRDIPHPMDALRRAYLLPCVFDKARLAPVGGVIDLLPDEDREALKNLKSDDAARDRVPGVHR